MLANEKNLKMERLGQLVDELWAFREEDFRGMPVLLLDRVRKRLVHVSVMARSAMFQRVEQEK